MIGWCIFLIRNAAWPNIMEMERSANVTFAMQENDEEYIITKITIIKKSSSRFRLMQSMQENDFCGECGHRIKKDYDYESDGVIEMPENYGRDQMKKATEILNGRIKDMLAKKHNLWADFFVAKCIICGLAAIIKLHEFRQIGRFNSPQTIY